MKRNQYIDSVIEKIEQVRADETIRQAAAKIVEVIEENGTLYTFGASHAGILSEELFYRAGGLALFNPIMDPNLMLDTRPVTKTSASESLLAGLAAACVHGHGGCKGG